MKKIEIMCIAALLTCGILSAQDNTSDAVQTIPSASALRAIIANQPHTEKSFTVVKSETIPYPAAWATLSEKEKLLRLYNILGRISTQKGISYISRRAGYKPKVLFEDSYYIDSPDQNNHKVLSDPVCSEIPPQTVRYAEQKDSTFGDNLYRHTLTATDKELLLAVTNLTPMKYHGISCVSTEELTMYTSVMQSPDGIVLTSAVTVQNHDRTVQILFMKVDIADSFSRRTDALTTWYKDQLNRSPL